MMLAIPLVAAEDLAKDSEMDDKQADTIAGIMQGYQDFLEEPSPVLDAWGIDKQLQYVLKKNRSLNK